MYVVWLSPGGSGGFTGISRDAEICPGFPPPQGSPARNTVNFGKLDHRQWRTNRLVVAEILENVTNYSYG